MSECDFSLKVITPTLVYGNDSKTIELRQDFFENEMKFLWKAIVAIDNKNELLKTESAFFGNEEIDNSESPLKLRIGYMNFIKSKYYETNQNGKIIKGDLKEALMPNSKYSLYIYSRNDVNFYKDLAKLTFILNGIGEKKEIGFGVSVIENIDFKRYRILNIANEIFRTINKLVKDGFQLIEEKDKYIIERKKGINVNYKAIEKIEVFKSQAKWEKITEKIEKYKLLKQKSEDNIESNEILKYINFSFYETNKKLYPIITYFKPILPKGMNLSRLKIDEYQNEFKKAIL